METPKFDNIEELHEYVFQILLSIHEENSNFKFTLRQPHQFIAGKMKHWFYGDNDESLYFSCWRNKNDHLNLHISFHVNMNGDVTLYLQRYSNTHSNITYNIYKNITTQKTRSGDKTLTIFLHKIGDVEDFKSKWHVIDKIIVGLGSQNNFMTVIDDNEFKRRLDFIQEKREGLYEKKLEPHHVDLGYSINLGQLSLQNIGHFSSIHLDLSKKITCFIGENGSGKSTILRALGLALAGVNEKRINAKHSNIVNLLKIKGLDAESKTENYEFKGEICLTYNENLQNKVQFQFQYGDLVVKEEGDYKNVQDLYYFPQLILAFPQIQGKNENGNGHSLIKQSRANVKDVRNLIYNEPDNRFDEFSDWIINLFATSNEKKASGKENAPMEAKMIEKVFQIVSEVTAQKVEFVTVNHETETVWVRTTDAPEGIPLALISQGYNNVFGWVGYFMKRLAEVNPTAEDFTQCRALLLIDEIDTYLHPKWQVNILAVLLQHFPHTQIVVTTHSPYIVGSIPNKDLRIYICQKEGEVEEFTDFLPYGVNLERLSEKIFGVKGRYVTIVREKLEELFALIHAGELTKAKDALTHNFTEIDANDLELQRYKMLIRTKEILAQ